jgi:hypothetical protein
LAASFLMDEEAGVDDAGELVVKLPMYSSSLFEDLASSAPGSPAAGSLWPLDPLVPCREAAAPACDGVGQSPRWGERGWSLPPTAGEPGVPLTLPQRALPPAPLALRLDAPETPTALSCLPLHAYPPSQFDTGGSCPEEPLSGRRRPADESAAVAAARRNRLDRDLKLSLAGAAVDNVGGVFKCAHACVRACMHAYIARDLM